MKPINVSYEYFNRNSYPMEIILAWPNEIIYGAPIEILHLSHEPEMVSVRDRAGNQFAIVVVYPNERLRFEYQVMRAPKRDREITEVDREYFLQAKELGKIPPMLLDHYLKASRSYHSDQEKAKFFFEALIHDFAFQDVLSPKIRGSDPFMERKLESVDFARLFATLCRKVGIPARIVYGSMSSRMYRPHAWNEIYLEKEGWIAVDLALARMHKYQKRRADELFLSQTDYRNMFGEIEEIRPIFAIQLESGEKPDCSIFELHEKSPSPEQLWGIAMDMDLIAWYPPPAIFLQEEEKGYFFHRLKKILYFFLVIEMAARPYLYFNGDWKVIRSPFWEWGWRTWIYLKNMAMFSFMCFLFLFLFGTDHQNEKAYLLLGFGAGVLSHLLKCGMKIEPRRHLLQALGFLGLFFIAFIYL